MAITDNNIISQSLNNVLMNKYVNVSTSIENKILHFSTYWFNYVIFFY